MDTVIEIYTQTIEGTHILYTAVYFFAEKKKVYLLMQD